MATPRPEVVRISSPSDVVAAVGQLLGFVPSESVVAMCLHGPRRRLGLAMRFDLELAEDPAALATSIDKRLRREAADGVFVVIFTDATPDEGGFPHTGLVDWLQIVAGDLLTEAFLVVGGRQWSYLCDDPRCCPPEGNLLNPQSPGALALAAAYALEGQGVLPDRDAVVRSIAYLGDPDATLAMTALIDAAREGCVRQSVAQRRLAIRRLVSRLSTASHDPRAEIADDDVAQLVALCDDVVVRDEVLIRCRQPRRRAVLLRVLTEVARRVPAPYDAAICASLAWCAYASGDGVVTNVAIDRVLRTDPDYSLALLISDSLQRQVPPWVLEDVMRGAARDLRGRSAAG